MAANLLFHPGVEKDLKKLPTQIQNRFFKAVKTIQENPLIGISLKGEFKGSYKYRIGDYRLVYKFFTLENTVVIYRIESRQGVYKK